MLKHIQEGRSDFTVYYTDVLNDYRCNKAISAGQYLRGAGLYPDVDGCGWLIPWLIGEPIARQKTGAIYFG